MTADEVRYTDVVCIGAGFAGICVGAQLQRQLGVDSFHIYEREASVGGTWFKNQYPGVMCDVPSIVYSLSFAPRRNWSDLYAPYQEILAYLTDVSRKYDLERRTSLRTQVTAAAWDDERKRWRVTLRNVDSGAEFAHECKLLFTGVGQFGRPRTVEDLGAIGPERFAGPILLSTSWDHSVDLTGKRVVLIGNGCTGNQILPALADKVESIVQLSRSRHWIVRDERQAPAAIVGFMGRYVPWIAPIFRKGLVAYMERNWIGFPNSFVGLWMRRRREKEAREYIKKRVPAKYLHMLIPEDVPFNCKRRILDERELYTSALHKSNVLLAEERVVEFQEHAVVTDKGTTYPADAIILATGFLNNDGGVVSTGLKIHGRNGLSLQDYWTTKYGGPEAYDTVAVSGFPNMFMLLGPNSLTGHTSALLAIENGVDLALKVCKSVLKGKKSIVEVKPDAERKYYDKLHAKLATSVWGGGCHSYYTRGGHNASTYPWSQFTFWWRCRFPTWRDWVIA